MSLWLSVSLFVLCIYILQPISISSMELSQKLSLSLSPSTYQLSQDTSSPSLILSQTLRFSVAFGSEYCQFFNRLFSNKKRRRVIPPAKLQLGFTVVSSRISPQLATKNSDDVSAHSFPSISYELTISPFPTPNKRLERERWRCIQFYACMGE